MKILVCISSVPDTTSKINFIENNTKFDENGIQFVINPYDEFGLTKAVMIKEQNQASITALTVGAPSVEPILRNIQDRRRVAATALHDPHVRVR